MRCSAKDRERQSYQDSTYACRPVWPLHRLKPVKCCSASCRNLTSQDLAFGRQCRRQDSQIANKTCSATSALGKPCARQLLRRVTRWVFESNSKRGAVMHACGHTGSAFPSLRVLVHFATHAIVMSMAPLSSGRLARRPRRVLTCACVPLTRCTGRTTAGGRT